MKESFFIRDGGFYRNLAALAVPICLQQYVSHAVSFADNVMVGRLGEVAIGALYIGSVIQLLLSTLVFGIASATIILTSQYWGRQSTGPIREIVSIAMRVSVVLGLFFSVAAISCPAFAVSLISSETAILADAESYLRAVGISYLFFCVSQMLLTAMRSVEIVRIGLVNSIIAFFVNVSLNYVFIFGKLGCPAMGVVGAAYGTVIARLVELGVVAFYVFRIDRTLRIRLADFKRWNGLLWHDLFRCGAPVMLGQLVWAVNLFSRAAIIGRMSRAGLASAGIVDGLDGLLWMGPLGLAIAAGIVTGKTIGAGEMEKIRPLARTLQVIFAAIGVFSCLFVFAITEPFLSIYKVDATTLAAARTFFVVFAISMLGRSYQAAGLMGLVKAGGDTTFMLKNDAFWVFCWVLPSALVAQRCFHLPDVYVYAFLLSDQITKCFVAYVKINRYDWMKRLARKQLA